MSTAHKRKKDPQAVRQQLLEVAADLCVEKGAVGLTLDAVAAAAGVSKGGLLHHFPSKAELLFGLLDDLIARMDAAIDAAMRADPEPHGRFTRAYVAVTFGTDAQAEEARWKAMTMPLLTEPALRARWREWVALQAELNVGTDSSLDCVLARFALDGLWLASVLESHPMDPEQALAMKQRLFDLSRG